MPVQFAKWKLEPNKNTYKAGPHTQTRTCIVHTPTSHQLSTITNGFHLPNQFSLDLMWCGWCVCVLFSRGVQGCFSSSNHTVVNVFVCVWLHFHYLDNWCTYHIFLSVSLFLFGLTHDLVRCNKISDAIAVNCRGGFGEGEDKIVLYFVEFAAMTSSFKMLIEWKEHRHLTRA